MVKAQLCGQSRHAPRASAATSIHSRRQYLSRRQRVTATINFLGAQFPSPFFGLNPQYTSSTMRPQSLLLPYPQFGNITYLDPVGYSWYHSLQAQGEKRFAHGFTLQVAYTWSRAMEATTFLNAHDPMPYESLASHRPRAPRYGQRNLGAAVRQGTPLLAPHAAGARLHRRRLAVERRLAAAERPADRLGSDIITGDSTKLVLPSDQRNADRWFNTSIFDRLSGDQVASNLRTFPLRFSNVRLDSQRRLDFSVNKTFPITERFKMRFRADSFNVFNTPVLQGPNTSATGSTFGTVSGQEPPRSFQFSLNLQF